MPDGKCESTLPVAGSIDGRVSPLEASRHCPPRSILAGLARKARVAVRISGEVIILASELRLIKVRIAAAVGRGTGKTDPLPDARIAEVKGTHVCTQLAEEGG